MIRGVKSDRLLHKTRWRKWAIGDGEGERALSGWETCGGVGKQREGDDGSAERPVVPVGSNAWHVGLHPQRGLFPNKKETMHTRV